MRPPIALAAAALVAAALALLTGPSAAYGEFVHTVAPGESLSSIAATDGLTVAELAAANGLPVTAELIAGSGVAIPPRGSEVQGGEVVGGGESSTEAAPSYEPVPSAAGDGDQDSDEGVGEPATAGEPSPSSAAAAAASQPVGEAAEGSPGGPPYTTPETVSPVEIASIAATNGVPSSLVNAIAYQESGFNNALTSTADARGVMQITPGTWSWIEDSLAGAPLAPSSALENVRAGALMLHSLLQATGGDEALAAAGYYQGLPSVRENGVYPETQRYVEDVQALQQQFGG